MSFYRVEESGIFQQKLSFICKSCFAIQGDITISLRVDKSNTNDGLSSLFSLFPYGTCCSCGQDNEYDMNSGYLVIDTEIAHIISSLNKLCLFTEFSCAGHMSKESSMDNIYISFSNNSKYRVKRYIKKYGAPQSWYCEENHQLGLYTAPYSHNLIYLDGPGIPFDVDIYKDFIITVNGKLALDWSKKFNSFDEYQQFHMNSMIDWINKIKTNI